MSDLDQLAAAAQSMLRPRSANKEMVVASLARTVFLFAVAISSILLSKEALAEDKSTNKHMSTTIEAVDADSKKGIQIEVHPPKVSKDEPDVWSTSFTGTDSASKMEIQWTDVRDDDVAALIGPFVQITPSRGGSEQLHGDR